MEDFAAVGSEAVFVEVLVEMFLEADVVSRGGVGGWRCQCPAHVSSPRGVVVARVFVDVVLGDLVEVLPDGVRDVFDDLGGCVLVLVGGMKVVEEECLVKGEDALDFDAEG